MSVSPHRITALAFAISVLASAAVPALAAAKHPFLNSFTTTSTIGSAVPSSGKASGDQNPYGIAVVPTSVGRLVRGDVLISNFNDAMNQQGTGASIMQISPAGQAKVFAVVPAPTSTRAVGLTTALVVLRSGYVIVGSLPAPGGSSSAARAGALTILNSHGHVVEVLRGGPIDGPWDMTALDQGNRAVLFVTNVLNGTVKAAGATVKRGTVVRITLRIPHGMTPIETSRRVIANGFAEHTDPNALVVGPTGVGLGHDGVLYVADSVGSRIAAIPAAVTRTAVLGGGGMTIASGHALNDPLGLTVTPSNDILTANGADGNIVETTPGGAEIATRTLVANGGGDLFGLALAPHGHGLYFTNDAGSGPAANSLDLLH